MTLIDAIERAMQLAAEKHQPFFLRRWREYDWHIYRNRCGYYDSTELAIDRYGLSVTEPERVSVLL